MGRLSWITQVGPKCNHRVLIRGKQREVRAGRGEGDARMGARGWNDARKGSQTKERRQLGARKGKEMGSPELQALPTP